MPSSRKNIIFAYLGIISVVLIWGVIPTLKKALIGEHFSSSLYTHMTSLAGAISLLLFSIKDLKKINKSYLKLAIPTGLCVAVATLLQAIAYNYDASPTKQAFLENISCIVVPVLLFLIIKKKPSALTIGASIICLLSSFILGDIFTVGLSFGVADILNALAGVFYGINIAITGIYAKRFNAKIFVMIQLFVQTFVSYIAIYVFNQVEAGGHIIDPIVFTPEFWYILAVFAIGIVTNSVCWTMRTVSMQYVSANVVAVIMPFSAVITGIVSVIIGMDTLSPTLIIGATLGLIASLMSSGGDIVERRREEKNKNE